MCYPPIIPGAPISNYISLEVNIRPNVFLCGNWKNEPIGKRESDRLFQRWLHQYIYLIHILQWEWHSSHRGGVCTPSPFIRAGACDCPSYFMAEVMPELWTLGVICMKLLLGSLFEDRNEFGEYCYLMLEQRSNSPRHP